MVNELIDVAPFLKTKLNTIMTDKQFALRKCLREAFPNVSMLICRFHSIQIFKREITVTKYQINMKQKTLILSTLNKMLYANTKNQYEELKNELYNHNIPNLTQYFKKHWDPIADEWIFGISNSKNSFNNASNNRLESVNGKIKDVVEKSSTMEDFLMRFFDFLQSMKIERKNKSVSELLKPFAGDDEKPALKQYYTFLTPFAANIVFGELAKIKNIETSTSTSINDCNCLHKQSFNLPCFHIFKNRAMNVLSMFDEALCGKRWSRKYAHNYLCIPEVDSKRLNYEKIITKKPKETIKSYSQKLKLSSVYTNKLAATTSEYCGDFYQLCLNSIQSLEEIIKNKDDKKLKNILKQSIFYVSNI